MDFEEILLGKTGNDDMRVDAIKEYYDNRTLILNNSITEDVLEDLSIHILLWNKDDKDLPVDRRRPIFIYLDSEGGNCFSANNLIDVIRASKTPVFAVGFSLVASAAFSVYIACDKRYAFNHTVFLIHDGTKAVSNSGSKARDFMDFLDRMDDLDKDLILSRTNITEEDYEQKKRNELFFFSTEAQNMGIVDEIIGKDCTVDEII